MREANGVTPPRYETIPHTADLAVRVNGAGLEELFANAGFAMFDVMFVGREEPTQSVPVELTADSLEDLLVDWLSELLFSSETLGLAFFEFDLELTDHRLRAEARGCPVDRLELRSPPIKAVTYHHLVIGQEGEGWVATVVFDV